jgi:hypothetical protein
MGAPAAIRAIVSDFHFCIAHRCIAWHRRAGLCLEGKNSARGRCTLDRKMGLMVLHAMMVKNAMSRPWAADGLR